MCQYCAEHGDGKKWYLNMENYTRKLLDDVPSHDREIIMNDHMVYLKENRWPLSKHTRRMLLSSFGSKVAGKGVYERFMEKWHLGQVVSNAEATDILAVAGDEVPLMECLCRKMKGQHDQRTCFGLSLFGDLIETNLKEGQFKVVSKDEAKAIMDDFEREHGWYHSVWTLRTPFVAYLCNCDEKACMGMMGKDKGSNVMKKGHTLPVTDGSKCAGCGTCVSACHFDARKMSPDNVPVSSEKCHGCGVCKTMCGQGAISMAPVS